MRIPDTTTCRRGGGEDSSGPVRSLLLFLGVGMVLVGLGCEPPPLTTPPDVTVSDADEVADLPPPPEFRQVAGIIRANCAQMNCHAAPDGNANFSIEGGTEASDSAIADSLRDTTVENESTPLIAAGDPDGSALYQALVGSDGRTQMPLEGPLEESTIERVRRWIAAGAAYE